MNLNKLIQMVIGLFLKKGVALGVDHLARRGKPASEMTAAERAQADSARQTAKRARQAANLARKLGR